MRICTPKPTRCYISGSTPPTHTPTRHYANSHPPTRHYAIPPPPPETGHYANSPRQPDIMQIPLPTNRTLREFPLPHQPDIMRIPPPPPHTNRTLCKFTPPTRHCANIQPTRRYWNLITPPPLLIPHQPNIMGICPLNKPDVMWMCPPTPSLSILSDPPPTRNYGNLIHPFYQRDVMWICLKGEGTKSMTGKPRWEGITNPMFTFAASARKQKACGCKERI